MKHLVFLLLLSSVCFFALSKVVDNFKECEEFFLDDKPPVFTPPAGVSVKPICQCLQDNNDKQIYLYATLYSTTWKIPVYSAYVFRKSKSIGRCDTWYIEPQLEDSRDSGDSEQCMGPQGSAVKTSSNQALNSDYKDSNNYHKGHLYPVLHTDNHLSMLATSTLTNAAPQDSDFNTNEWLEHERVVINNLQSCDKAYVVTGVVPDMQAPKLNNRVYVSKYYWRATCCLKNNQYTGQGYYGLDNNNQVKKLTIKDLQDFLKNVYQITFFPSVPTSNTEAKKPRIDKACN
ncbi:endonuclease domain-containing 1 protein-like [Cyprinus carpio]|uniref:Endonuclease domain-containing 1 protein n=2 Tax=Cyprinus carpio TaxID=7962 RepID=A0A8C1FL52_CYPCA|nr:endonuclease domain-containing 1 protein-like [Cyprinus carpio]